MNAHVEVQADERTIDVAHKANTWGLIVLNFGLLLDILYRSVFRGEAPWDLFALLILSGAVNVVYSTMHKAPLPVISRKLIAFIVVLAVVSAAAGAFLAMP